MEHLFSLQGMASMAALMSARPLLALDFDGTIAPIVEDPDAAVIFEGAVDPLRRLARVLPVAVVTGRSVADVRPRLGFEPSHIVGSHGAEGLGEEPLADAMRHVHAWLELHRALLEHLEVVVEDKRHSIALHYRRATDPARAYRVLARLLDELGPYARVFGGKMVFNIVAACAPDKAAAVHELVRREKASGAVFFGDDENDEPVFASAPPHWVPVKVGSSSPPVHRSAARYHLADGDEVVLMLQWMAAQRDGAT